MFLSTNWSIIVSVSRLFGHCISIEMITSLRVSCAIEDHRYVLISVSLLYDLSARATVADDVSKMTSLKKDRWPISFTLARRKQCETPNNACEDQNK